METVYLHPPVAFGVRLTTFVSLDAIPCHTPLLLLPEGYAIRCYYHYIQCRRALHLNRNASSVGSPTAPLPLTATSFSSRCCGECLVQIVEPGVFRANFIKRENFDFVKQLGLRTVIVLSPEKLMREVCEFLADQDVLVVGVDGAAARSYARLHVATFVHLCLHAHLFWYCLLYAYALCVLGAG